MEASFSTLITSIAEAALMHLGFIKNPQTQKEDKNMELAQVNIDLLVLLKEKTKGNLSEEETNLLNAIITDLQLKFVQAKS